MFLFNVNFKSYFFCIFKYYWVVIVFFVDICRIDFVRFFISGYVVNSMVVEVIVLFYSLLMAFELNVV